MTTSSFVMIVIVGLTVDLGGQVHTQQRARDIAAQAARTGAQEVQASRAIRGDTARVDVAAATAASNAYLTASGVTGTVSVQDGDTLVVDVHDTYHCRFLSIIGLDQLDVTGEAQARMIRTEGGVER